MAEDSDARSLISRQSRLRATTIATDALVTGQNKIITEVMIFRVRV